MTFDKYSDVIDSRDVIARIEELREFLADEGLLNSDAREELHTLESLASEGEGCADWAHGEALIRDSYFETYAQELAEDCCDMSADAVSHWPFTCIDWERAARELQMDYTSIDFDGVTYWVRS